MMTVRCLASHMGRAVQHRCRSGLCHDEQRAQANEYGFQSLLPPDRGQGRGSPTEEPLVSLVCGTLPEAARADVMTLTLP
jgi:hypothetical protein